MSASNGGRVLAAALRAHGVRHVASLHGGHLDPFWDACLDEGIRLIDTRHEQAAVHVAEGWAWATGEAGVAVVTAGPGVTDAMTGIVNASASGAPIVVIGGRVPSFAEGTRALQDIDLVPLVELHAKSAATVRRASHVSAAVDEAFMEAWSGRPGPTFLDVPADVLARRPKDGAARNPVRADLRERTAAPAIDVGRAAEAIARAERPVVLAGSGVHWSGASAALEQWIETTGIPVLTHAGGRGVISDTHPLCMGSGSPVAGAAAITALTQSDCIVCVGVRFNFTVANGQPPLFAAGADIVRIDIDPEEPNLGRPATHPLVGDARTVLGQLAMALPSDLRVDGSWVDTLRATRTAALEDQRRRVDEAEGIHPLDLVLATNDVLGDQLGTIVVDGGEIQVWGLMGARVLGPGRFLTVGPLGTLGIGLPFALATKLARPDEPTVLICGDGAFGFNAMELESAVRHDLPIVVLVSNDRGWGMSRHGQGLVYGYDRVNGTELPESTRYDRIAEGMGAAGFHVTERAELRPTIEKALALERPACIDVRVDREIVSDTTRMMVGAGVGH